MKVRNIGSLILITVGLAAIVIGGGIYIRQEGDYAASNAEYDLAQETFLLPTAAPGVESGRTYDLSQGSDEIWDDIIPAEPIGEADNPEPDSGANKGSVPVKIPEAPDVDWEALAGTNADVVGWIRVPAIDISYPVLIGDDNDEYLHQTMYGSYLYAGSIFLDYANSRDWTDQNTVIYGHNMRNGSMFGKLKQFQDKETYDRCPYILISTPEGDKTYQVMSVRVVDIHSDAYKLFGPDEPAEAFTEWCERQAGSSNYPCPLPDIFGNRCITLSTCTAASDDTRLIVQAIEVLSDTADE